MYYSLLFLLFIIIIINILYTSSLNFSNMIDIYLVNNNLSIHAFIYYIILLVNNNNNNNFSIIKILV